MHRGVGSVHGIELIVARRGRSGPRGRSNDANHPERLVPDAYLTTDSVHTGPKDLLANDAAEHQHLLGIPLLATTEETSMLKCPRAPNLRNLQIGAVQAGEPSPVAMDDTRVFVNSRRHVLNAANLVSYCVCIGTAQRRRGAESCRRIAEPLTCGRMIVLLHRIVFGM